VAQLVAAIQQTSGKDPNESLQSTLYLVALRDYFLLPSTLSQGNSSSSSPPSANSSHYANFTTLHNDSLLPPPRLTLILPALSAKNASRGSDTPYTLTMMRIECEVVGTGMLHLPGTVIPLFNNGQR